MSRFLEHDWFPDSLPDNVVLGERNWLYSTFAFRHYQSRRAIGLRTGHDTGLYHGTFFDLGPDAEVWIGNYCTLVGAIICTNGRVEIADYVFVAHEVVIADCFAAVPSQKAVHHMTEAALPHCSPTIQIGENAWIGARAVLLSGATIGAGAIVGSATVVNFEVPPGTIVAGNPARIVKRLR